MTCASCVSILSRYAREVTEARTRLTLTGHVERSEGARLRAESHSNLCGIRAIARSLAVCAARDDNRSNQRLGAPWRNSFVTAPTHSANPPRLTSRSRPKPAKVIWGDAKMSI